jgi:chromosome segregation ATPase
LKKEEIVKRQFERISELESTEAQNLEELSKLKGEVNKLSSENGDLISQITIFESKLAQKDELEKELLEKIQTLSDENNNEKEVRRHSEEKNKKFIDSIDKKNLIIEDLSNNLKEIELEKSEWKKITDEKNSIIIKQSHKITETEEFSKELEHKIAEVNEENNELKLSNESLKKKLNDLNDELTEITEERNSLRNSIREKEATMRQQEERISTLSIEIKTKNSENKDLLENLT